MTKTEFVSRLNSWGAAKSPFLFIVDFEFEKPQAFKLSQVDSSEIAYDIEGFTNSQRETDDNASLSILKKEPLSFAEYKARFDLVYERLSYGDSYLTNLTTKTGIDLDNTLLEIFGMSRAKYKLLYKDQFLVFSPECFVKIKGNRIFSFPMKGTIDSAIPDATSVILNDKKELAEHVTIVDLIRNDLSQVARNVEVTRFRYIDEIKTNQRNLLQVSSEIQGVISAEYENQFGTILEKLLPAGSVSGAPKPMTLQIIQQAEQEKRGYYTGVFGYFDGHELNSGVMIRFIEKKNGTYFYRSGGGITTQSDAQLEYQETISKVYVPVD